VEDLYRSRSLSVTPMRGRFYGIAETIWSPSVQFLKEYYNKDAAQAKQNTQSNAFRALFDKMGQLDQLAATK
jgi:hypothetical protein